MTGSPPPPRSAAAGTCSASRGGISASGSPGLSDLIASRLNRAASSLAARGGVPRLPSGDRCGRRSSCRDPFACALLVGPNTEETSSALDSALERCGFDWIRPDVPLSCEGQLDSAYRSMISPFLRRGRSVACPSSADPPPVLPKLVVFEQYPSLAEVRSALSKLGSLSRRGTPGRPFLALCLIDRHAGAPPGMVFTLPLSPGQSRAGSRTVMVPSQVSEPSGSADRWSFLARRYSEAISRHSGPGDAEAFRLSLMKELESDPDSTMFLAVWMIRTKADACASRDPSRFRRLVSAVAAAGRLRSAASTSLMAHSIVCGLGLCNQRNA